MGDPGEGQDHREGVAEAHRVERDAQVAHNQQVVLVGLVVVGPAVRGAVRARSRSSTPTRVFDLVTNGLTAWQ